MSLQTIKGSKMFSVCIEDTVFKIRNISLSIMDKYDIGLHFHHNFEVHCILSGNEELSTLDKETSEIKCYTADEHSMMIVPPNTFHATRSNSDFSFFNITFDIKPTDKNTQSQLFKELDKALKELHTPLIIKNEEVAANLRSILRYITSPTGYIFCDTNKMHIAISRMLLNIADSLIKDEFPSSSTKQTTSSIQDREFLIKEFIYQRYSIPNALSELAKTLHLSERQTQISVKKIMGKTFKELILEQKMTIAKMLIETTNLSLNEIAENIGYNSYASFFTAYKNHYGCSPVQHRNSRENIGPVE